MTNLNTAFDVAERYLDIPRMLDAEGKGRGAWGVLGRDPWSGSPLQASWKTPVGKRTAPLGPGA